jgi:FolB domain-containing protein
MDLIIIKELQIETIVGVLPEEKLRPQLLLLDIEIQTDLSSAGKSDHLSDTIDYSAIAAFIHDYAKQHHFELLEAFATNLIDAIMTKFQLKHLKLLVQKPKAIASAKYAAICMTRKSG